MIVDLGAGLVDVADDEPIPHVLHRRDPEVIVAPDGSRWRTRCPCGAHTQPGPTHGHDARPLP